MVPVSVSSTGLSRYSGRGGGSTGGHILPEQEAMVEEDDTHDEQVKVLFKLNVTLASRHILIESDISYSLLSVNIISNRVSNN